MYDLHIGNKNYSSWSLRPWVLMRELGIPFNERLAVFAGGSTWESFRKFSPTGRVPCLVDGDITVWDSLAITEYLAERHDTVWPKAAVARAWARSAAAEVHSGFNELRNRCSMSCGIRVRLNGVPAALQKDLDRLEELWNEGLSRFGGPYLAGKSFSAADAFYAPVAFRRQTYDLTFGPVASAYLDRLLALPAMQSWYQAGLAEKWRDPPHDDDVKNAGVLLEDLRAVP